MEFEHKYVNDRLIAFKNEANQTRQKNNFKLQLLVVSNIPETPLNTVITAE